MSKEKCKNIKRVLAQEDGLCVFGERKKKKKKKKGGRFVLA